MPRGGVRPGAGRPKNPMGPHQSITLWIPQDLVRRVDEIAQAAEVNRSQTIAALLADYLAGD